MSYHNQAPPFSHAVAHQQRWTPLRRWPCSLLHVAYCPLPTWPIAYSIFPIPFSPYSLFPLYCLCPIPHPSLPSPLSPLLPIPYSLFIAYALFPIPPSLPLFPPYCLFLVAYSSLVFVPYSLFPIQPLSYIPYSLSLFSPHPSKPYTSLYLFWLGVRGWGYWDLRI